MHFSLGFCVAFRRFHSGRPFLRPRRPPGRGPGVRQKPFKTAPAALNLGVLHFSRGFLSGRCQNRGGAVEIRKKTHEKGIQNRKFRGKRARNASRKPQKRSKTTVFSQEMNYLAMQYIYIYVFSAGIPQRPLPAQVTGGAASKKPQNA